MIYSTRAKAKPSNGAGGYTPHQLAEILKCSKDPKYFINTYALSNFDLHDQQELFIDAIEKHRQVVCLHPRQAGITTASLAYLLWESQFSANKSILIVLPTQMSVDAAIREVTNMYTALPKWMKADLSYHNRFELAFVNGTRIKIEKASVYVGRGSAVSTLYLGDLAQVDEDVADEMWYSLVPCLSTGSKFIAHSTPAIGLNLFYSMWQSTLAGNTPLEALEISFWDLPGGTQARWNYLEAMLGNRTMRQEYGNEFLP